MEGSRGVWKRFRRGSFAVAVCVIVGCSGGGTASPSTTDPTSTTSTSIEPSTTVATIDLPTVVSVSAAAGIVPAYGRLDLAVELEAEYQNPFDQRQIALDAVFTDESGATWEVPGFWNGRDAWAIRFTPSSPGTWQYSVTVTDRRGTSSPFTGSFEAEPSDARGFLRVGSAVDPDYSSRYLAYEDGTPWYGFGHADLGMSWNGYDGTTFRKMADMVEIGENLEMWWPLWAMNYLQNDYATYNPTTLDTIDLVLTEAERHGIGIAFTIWNHQL